MRTKYPPAAIAQAAELYDSAIATVLNRDKFAPILVKLMADAIGTDRLDWLQVLFPLVKTHEAFHLKNLFDHALFHDANKCLEWLVANNKKLTHATLWKELLMRAAFVGNDAALRTISGVKGVYPENAEQKWTAWSEDWSNPTAIAVRAGDMARLKLLVELGCPMHQNAAYYAVASGNADMIEHCRQYLVPVVNTVTHNGGPPVVLPVDEYSPDNEDNDNSMRSLFVPVLEDINSKRAAQQIKRGFAFARSLNYPTTDQLSWYVLEEGLNYPLRTSSSILNVMATAYFAGISWTEATKRSLLQRFTQTGSMEYAKVVEWAHQHGAQFDSRYNPVASAARPRSEVGMNLTINPAEVKLFAAVVLEINAVRDKVP